jgi:hypothetical protein
LNKRRYPINPKKMAVVITDPSMPNPPPLIMEGVLKDNIPNKFSNSPPLTRLPKTFPLMKFQKAWTVVTPIQGFHYSGYTKWKRLSLKGKD